MTALRRRWKIVISGLLLTVIAAFLVIQIMPPAYQATGSVLFIAPSTTTDGPSSDPVQPANPYLNFGTPLAATAEVVSASVNSQTTQNQLKASGSTGSYQVALDPNSDAPLMSVEATSKDPAKAMATRTAVIREIRSKLNEIQLGAGAPLSQYIRSQTVTISDNAPRVHGSLVRALAVIAIVGVVLTCVIAITAEGVRRGRARDEQAPGRDDHTDDAELRAAMTGNRSVEDRRPVEAAASRTPDS